MSHPIIVGFDGSEHGRDAITLGRAVAATLDAPLIVLCAYTPEQWFWAEGTAATLNEGERARIETAAEAELGESRYELRMVPSQSAAGALQTAAEEEGAELIVVGSPHRAGLGRVLLGTVTAAVLDAAPCAVLVAPAGLAAAGPIAFETVGVGFDDTPEAYEALETARSIAVRTGGRLAVIWAANLVGRTLPLSFAGYLTPNYFEDVRSDVQERLERALEPLREELAVSGEIASGESVTALVERSKELDLLVLGSRGYGPLKRVLLGGVSRAVVDRARCPVLVVRRGAQGLDAAVADATAGARV